MVTAKQPITPSEHRGFVEAYKKVQQDYIWYGEVLKAILQMVCAELAPLAIVQARAKSISSFAEKIIRKWDEYNNPLFDMTDLCGVRVITETQEDEARMVLFIRGHFRVDEANSPNIQERLSVGEFGYLSEHLVVQLPWAENIPTKASRNSRLQPIMDPIDGYCAEHQLNSMDVYDAISEKKAEIQVRTLLQHAWADISHERLYKAEYKPPKKLERELRRVAALLEDADDAFSRAIRKLETYGNENPAYMTSDRLASEIEKYEMVLQYEPENLKTARRIAQLALASHQWGKAIKALEPPENIQNVPKRVDAWENATVLRDRGWAMNCSGQDGRSSIEKAITKNSKDAQSHWYLAKTFCNPKSLSVMSPACDNPDCRNALKYFTNAFDLSPTEPNIIGDYLKCKICMEKRVQAVAPMRPGLVAAISLCIDRAQVGVYLPDAYFYMGLFHLMLRDPYKSLCDYTKAVHLCHDTVEIRTAIDSVDQMKQAVRRSLIEMQGKSEYDECEVYLNWYAWCEWVERFLSIAVVGKLSTMERDANAECEKWEAEKERCEAHPEKDKDGKILEEVEKFLTQAAERRKSVQEEANQLGHSRGFNGLGFDPDPIRKPVVIVAGGCDVSVQDQMSNYLAMLHRAFEGFSGTIVSGGTTAGVSGMVAEFSKHNEIENISYFVDSTRLPEGVKLSKESKRRTVPPVDPGVKCQTEPKSVEFSPLEPIQGWIDLLQQDIKPCEVRLLGLNGGQISAFEYRMALALGATVGIIEHTGRAANELKKEQEFWSQGRLIWIPDDADCVRAFVQSQAQPASLNPEDVDRAAEASHNRYMEQKKKESLDPSTRPWNKLDQDLKDSNIQQVRYAPIILATENYELIQLNVVDARPTVETFTDEEVERMAEKEHGRFVIERLTKGWTPGDRNTGLKKSPYLIPWNQIKDPVVMKYDVEIVLNYPTIFHDIGYRIVKKS